MAIRVAHLGTGNVGKLALAGILGAPGLELTGLWVSNEEKIGQDAGKLAGRAQVGIRATGDLDELIATRPDCAVYCAMGDVRTLEAIEDCKRLLAAGINVVGSAPVSLQYPWQVLPEKFVAGVEDAAAEGGSSLFITGIDPGFANDLVPLVFAGTCQRVDSVRCMEIADYATYDGATVMFEVMGFGLPPEKTPMLYQPGVLSIAWGTTIRQLAAGLGVAIDEITDTVEREPAPEAFDVSAGHIPAGGTAAVRFEIVGKSGGRPVITVEHVTRLRPDLRPDWAQPAHPGGSYRVRIEGEPSYTVDIGIASEHGDHNHSAIVAAAGRIVNSIPAVVAAPPGIHNTLDLPLVTGKQTR